MLRSWRSQQLVQIYTRFYRIKLHLRQHQQLHRQETYDEKSSQELFVDSLTQTRDNYAKTFKTGNFYFRISLPGKKRIWLLQRIITAITCGEEANDILPRDVLQKWISFSSFVSPSTTSVIPKITHYYYCSNR